MTDIFAGARYGFVADPESPGWLVRPAQATGLFIDIFGTIRVRVEAPDRVRIRIVPERRHLNIQDGVHGGFLLAMIDQAYFVGSTALGISGAMFGSTIDSSTQFIAPVKLGTPVDTVVEILRETGRMVFMRGLIEQAGTTAVSFAGTIRKSNASATKPS